MAKKSNFELNPFVVGRYPGPEYFCDREKETAELIKQVVNGRNVTLISPRRIGKTGLIRHLFQQPEIERNFYTFFVDIYATSSLAEFVVELGKTIFQELKPRGKSMLSRFFEIVSSLQVGFKVDAMTGEPSFQLGYSHISEPQLTLEEIFKYLNNADRPCVVAFDEFQQVGEYSDGNAEALLRTYIQQSTNCSFIFSGSKRHMMMNMFQSSKRPFYNSSATFTLGAIPEDSYVEFALRQFANRKKQIDEDAVRSLYQRVDGTTWYMQLLLNEGFAITKERGKMTVETCDVAINNIIDLQSSGYQSMFASLTAKQRELLRILAVEGEAKDILSVDFFKCHNLPSASSIQSIMKALLRYEMVDKTESGSYKIIDYFFAHWLAAQ